MTTHADMIRLGSQWVADMENLHRQIKRLTPERAVTSRWVVEEARRAFKLLVSNRRGDHAHAANIMKRASDVTEALAGPLQ